METQEQIPPNRPTTLDELLWYIDYYQPNIFVREQIDGKWGSYSLDKLSRKQRATCIAQWIAQGVIPCRIVNSTTTIVMPSTTIKD